MGDHIHNFIASNVLEQMLKVLLEYEKQRIAIKGTVNSITYPQTKSQIVQVACVLYRMQVKCGS